ncbi:MAG: 4Fe-4S binding protein [Clostridiales bacterium]|nr:4Fe-4S binding protein [Clostridiales bacterium]
MDKKKNRNSINGKKLGIQAVAALIQNANFKGFFSGKLYTGPIKKVCVPGLNCYSCPGAVGACPIGSLQNFLGGLKFRFPYYVLGLLLFFGTLLGRLVCGFLCPFGLLQDLLYLIPFYKKNQFKIDKYLRYLKFAVLGIFVILLPLCIPLSPAFCKYICPSGTTSGLWHVFLNSSVRKQLGAIFQWKLLVLGIVIVSALIVYRPFCKYLCPLGAFYGLFNKFSFFRMHFNESACVHCQACVKACKMNVDPTKNPNSMECIRCGDCVRACPEGALHQGFIRPKTDASPVEEEA